MKLITWNLNMTMRTLRVAWWKFKKQVKNWPWESWYDDRTYTDASGNEVRAYEDGADMTITVMEMQGDGVPDNPGVELCKSQ